MAVYLEAGHVVQAWKLLDVASLAVEASAVPWTADTTVAKVTFDQRSTVVGALVTDGCEFAILTDEQRLGVTNVHLLHPARINQTNELTWMLINMYTMYE